MKNLTICLRSFYIMFLLLFLLSSCASQKPETPDTHFTNITEELPVYPRDEVTHYKYSSIVGDYFEIEEVNKLVSMTNYNLGYGYVYNLKQDKIIGVFCFKIFKRKSNKPKIRIYSEILYTIFTEQEKNFLPIKLRAMSGSALNFIIE